MPQGKRFAITAPRVVELQSFEVPAAVAAGESLMAVTHSLISPGTEIQLYRSPDLPRPFFPGYTAVGTITAAGAGLGAGGRGRPVFLFPSFEDQVHCHASHKVVQPGAIVLPLPKGLDPGRACFARMVNVAMTPFCHLDARTQGVALVVGLGLVGNIAAQIARVRGFEVIGIDPDAGRRRRAADAGVIRLIDPTDGKAVERVKELTGGRGAMLTINATGAAATFPMAMEATAAGGELSNLGGARGTAGADLGPFLQHTFSRHVTIRGGWEMLLPRQATPGGHTPSTEENLRIALRWLLEGTIKVEPIWTHTIKPEGLAEAYQALDRAEEAYLGVVVDWR